MIDVTVINGKSSFSNFYHQILKFNNNKSASIWTIGIQFDNQNKSVGNTTLDPITLREVINKLSKKKINNIILEASSHGLKQNRLDGLLFDICIFTNFSHDHLDYNKNFNNYLNAKLYLFKH